MNAKRFLFILAALTLSACDAVDAFMRMVPHPLSYAGTVTYRDERFNYEIDYPTGWIVEETDYGIELRSYDPNSIPPEYWETMPPGHARIVITPLATTDSTSLADIIAGDVQRLPPLGCVYNDPLVFTLDSGRPAVEIMAYSDMGGGYSLIYTDLDGRYFEVNVWASIDVEAIVRSLRLMIPSRHHVQRNIYEDIRIEPQYYCLQ